MYPIGICCLTRWIISDPAEFDKKTGKRCSVTEICGNAGISKLAQWIYQDVLEDSSLKEKQAKYDQQSIEGTLSREVFFFSMMMTFDQISRTFISFAIQMKVMITSFVIPKVISTNVLVRKLQILILELRHIVTQGSVVLSIWSWLSFFQCSVSSYMPSFGED